MAPCRWLAQLKTVGDNSFNIEVLKDSPSLDDCKRECMAKGANPLSTVPRAHLCALSLYIAGLCGLCRTR